VSWDKIEGQWKQQRGKAVYHWGKMMNDELAVISGKQEERVGKLQEKFGIAKEEAKHQVEEFKRMIEQLKKANNKLIREQKVSSKQEKGVKKAIKLKTPARKRLYSNAQE